MAKSGRFFILRLEISHGADRYEIHLQQAQPATVRDLMIEIERKSRVTLSNQQLIFRGQRLHESPDQLLSKFGIFSGNQISLIGRKLPNQQDEHLRRLLNIERDIGSIDNTLESICENFEHMKLSGEPRSRLEPYLYDLQVNISRIQSNLTTLNSSLNELKNQNLVADSQRKHSELEQAIQDRLNVSVNIRTAIDQFRTEN